MQHQYVVGIDLGGTKVRAGIATIAGEILHETTEPTRDGRAIVAQVTEMVRGLAAAVGASRASIVATAIGGAGVPDSSTGKFDLAPNLGDLEGFDVVAELEGRLGHPVVIDNDVNIAALGELHSGVGTEVDTFAFVSVGTGIGVGVVLDRRIWQGVRGGAGEIGYLPIGSDPLDPGNQRRGALEEVVSGDSIAQRFQVASGRARSSAVEVFELAAGGDPDALASLDEEARWLAHAILAVDAVVDPGLFVLGGGIGSREELLAPVLHWLGRLGRPTIEVRISPLGSSAPILGAVRLAIDAAPLSTEREAS
ncbi:ROK family protein [Leifsonia sp. Leaf336]|uniref:ROK family protein n=1 Tax=Leifsonia sp. Leaf336 TaxID=1736341 RepID=UPI001F34C5A5|nr:ROK family protein [Leifsonia sp. Leaf336]